MDTNDEVGIAKGSKRLIGKLVEDEVDDFRAGGPNPVLMGLERRMDEHVAGPGAIAATVARLVASAADDQCRIGRQVMMARKPSSRLVELDLLAGQHERHQSSRRSGGTASPRIIATASSRLIIFWCSSLPSRRIATVPSSASRLPTTSSSGTFARLCSRTL